MTDVVGFPNWHVSGCQLGEETPLHSLIWLWRLLEPSNLVAPPKKYTFRIGTCIESIFAVDSSFISAVGAELELSYGRSQFCWRLQPILLRLHHSICSKFQQYFSPFLLPICLLAANIQEANTWSMFMMELAISSPFWQCQLHNLTQFESRSVNEEHWNSESPTREINFKKFFWWNAVKDTRNCQG